MLPLWCSFTTTLCITSVPDLRGRWGGEGTEQAEQQTWEVRTEFKARPDLSTGRGRPNPSDRPSCSPTPSKQSGRNRSDAAGREEDGDRAVVDGIFSSPPLCSLLGRSSSSVGARRPLPERGRGEERRGEEKRRGMVRVAAEVLVFPAGLFRREYFLVYLYRHACTREQCGITSLISSNQAVIFFCKKKIA